MMDIVLLVDGSMGFNDLANLKVGDSFYESDYGHVVRAEVTSEVVMGEGHEGRRTLEFGANVYDVGKGGVETEPRHVDYMSTEGWMHYGGKFYRRLVKWDRESQQEVE